MDVRNCRHCGRMFNYVSGDRVCPVCKTKLEEKFQEVKTYIRENKEANLPEISEATEVSVNQLKQWVREERLEFSESSPVGLECENCGTMIRTGRFCEKCKNGMANNLANSIRKKPELAQEKKKDPKDNPRMRFLQ